MDKLGGTVPQLDDEAQRLINKHPERNTFHFEDSPVVVSSDFCSGNLARCNKVGKSLLQCYISEDSKPYSTEGHYRTWFYFSVTNVPQGDTITFSMRNMNNQGKLYKAGLKPVYRVLPTNQKSWKRLPAPMSWDYGVEGFTLNWSFKFDFEASETVYFAFTWPWSYQEQQERTASMEEKFKFHSDIYFEREVLALSHEQRQVDLITISSFDKIKTEREALIEGLFPCHHGDPELRPYKFDKPTIFLTSRVHPGETPSSFVLNGFLNLLLNEKSEQGTLLRQKFVWKISPLLNPDGVARGYYRYDTKG